MALFGGIKVSLRSLQEPLRGLDFVLKDAAPELGTNLDKTETRYDKLDMMFLAFLIVAFIFQIVK